MSLANSVFLFSTVVTVARAEFLLAAATFFGSTSALSVCGTRRLTSNWTLSVPRGQRLSRFLESVCFEQNDAMPQPLSGSIFLVDTSAVCLSDPFTSRTETLNLKCLGMVVQLCM